MQNYLNAIGRIYTGIPTLVADGIYGNATANAVRTFQRLFGLTVDGIIAVSYTHLDVYKRQSIE